MLEKEIERKLKKRIEALGGKCMKFVSPGYAGVPDRIILLPGGVMAFVELKAPGKKERPLQGYVQNQLRGMGFKVFSSVSDWKDIEVVAAWAALEVAKATRRKAEDDLGQRWRSAHDREGDDAGVGNA